MNPFEWVDARTLESAISALQESPDAQLKAGGVDVLGSMKEGIANPPRLVNFRNAAGFDRIEGDAATGVRIGALVTLARLAVSTELKGAFQALVDAAGHAATPQIRNVATIGGNLLQRPRCWYFQSSDFQCLKKGGSECFALEGENRFHAIFGNGRCAIVHPSATAVALVALGATLEIATDATARTTMPIEDLFVRPEEDVMREHRLPADRIVTSIQLESRPRLRSAYVKQAEKESFDWPIADVAVALELGADRRCERARVVLGAAAPVPWRSAKAEAVLEGRVIDEAAAREAATASIAGATPLSMNRYKLPIFEAIVRRAVLAAAED